MILRGSVAFGIICWMFFIICCYILLHRPLQIWYQWCPNLHFSDKKQPITNGKNKLFNPLIGGNRFI